MILCSPPSVRGLARKGEPPLLLSASNLFGQPVCYSCASSSGRSPKYHAPIRAGERDRALPNFVTSHSPSATGTRNADARTGRAGPQFDREQTSACCAHSTTAATIGGGPRQRNGRGRCGLWEPGTAAGRGTRRLCPPRQLRGMKSPDYVTIVSLRSNRPLRLQCLEPHGTQPPGQTPRHRYDRPLAACASHHPLEASVQS